MKEFSLNEHEYVLLCDLLKVMNFCDSGGQAKMVISEGAVKVNEEVELRKKCKIRAGNIVEFSGEQVLVLK
ncbi:MAG: RNA-binding S4 domain-containing protein [Myxococcaceae bacterium]